MSGKHNVLRILPRHKNVTMEIVVIVERMVTVDEVVTAEIVIKIIPRPDPLKKEGPGIHYLCIHVIICSKRAEEEYMTFPIHVLDYVT